MRVDKSVRSYNLCLSHISEINDFFLACVVLMDLLDRIECLTFCLLLEDNFTLDKCCIIIVYSIMMCAALKLSFDFV